MGEWLTLSQKGRDSKAYLARPPAGSGPGVIVGHAWWGLNNCFQQICESLAEAGFVALAPDLYHGYVATTIAEAEIGRARLDREVAIAQMKGGAEYLLGLDGVTGDQLGSIGFSLGAGYSLGLTDDKKIPLAAAVAYYGRRGGNFKASQASFLLHFAETDVYLKAATANKLRVRLQGANRPVIAHTYPGTTHWFAEADQHAYNAAAATLAWDRTLKFLRATLPR